jgi:hypothetical protein
VCALLRLYFNSSAAGWSIGQSVGRSVGRLVGRSVGQLVSQSVGGLVGQLAGWLVGRSVGQSVGWLVGWRSVGWLLVGWSTIRVPGLWEVSLQKDYFCMCKCSEHHLRAHIWGIFGGKKNIKCSLPATNHQNTSRINSFHLPSNEMTPMRMVDGCHLPNMAPLVGQIIRESIHTLIDQPSILAGQRGTPS